MKQPPSPIRQDTPRERLEKAIMLQVNERLYQKNYISKTQYEYAKVEIVKM